VLAQQVKPAGQAKASSQPGTQICVAVSQTVPNEQSALDEHPMQRCAVMSQTPVVQPA
jgi:hypothetical protein